METPTIRQRASGERGPRVARAGTLIHRMTADDKWHHLFDAFAEEEPELAQSLSDRMRTEIPSYAAIARKANVCERTVATALARLRELGILHWVRRCAESWRDGRFVLEQETNAYAVLPESQWRGYRAPPEPPGPAPGTWGDPPPMLSAVAQAALEADLAAKVQTLASDPKDGLAAALARLGRAFMARDS